MRPPTKPLRAAAFAALVTAGLLIGASHPAASEQQGTLRPARLEVDPAQAPPAPFTDQELRVIRHIVERVQAGESRGAMSPDELSRATGVKVEDSPDSSGTSARKIVPCHSRRTA